MTWNDGLDGVHLEIAGSQEKRIAVLAGPGTGKTSFALMHRVARLLEEGVPGEKILLVSFTRTAAHDLQTKIDKLGVPGSSSVKATTLHSYCFEILNRESILELTRRTPRPLLDHEVSLMLRDIADDHPKLSDRKERLNAYVAGWARGELDHPGLAALTNDRKFEAEARAWMTHHKAIHIGEVVPIAYELIRTDPSHPERYKYMHVIVDEYQDLNLIEQRLLDFLSATGSLCIAGDDDQSIYGFRYAHPSGIRSQYASADNESFEISVCGRCPANILDIANSLIEQEPNRAKGALLASKRLSRK
ncbi:MAG: UvrD-helicase domain-containing protein [Thermomicrobiales bacterium]